MPRRSVEPTVIDKLEQPITQSQQVTQITTDRVLDEAKGFVETYKTPLIIASTVALLLYLM